jgi:hypothetical protein
MLIADTRSLSLLQLCMILTSPEIATAPCCRTNEDNAASSTSGSSAALPSFMVDLFRGPGHVTASASYPSQASGPNYKKFAMTQDALDKFEAPISAMICEVLPVGPTLIRLPR